MRPTFAGICTVKGILAVAVFFAGITAPIDIPAVAGIPSVASVPFCLMASLLLALLLLFSFLLLLVSKAVSGVPSFLTFLPF
jgi:hypothetical protein